jgi:hypothetical protein
MFIEEQIQLMEKEMGVFATQIKPQFGDDEAAYIQWLNMAYQLKKVAPRLTEEQLSPQSLATSKYKKTKPGSF